MAADDSVRLGWLQRAARILLYVATVAGLVFVVFGFYLIFVMELTNAGVAMATVGALLVLVVCLAFAILVAMVHTHAEVHRTRRVMLNLLQAQQAHHAQQLEALELIVRNVQLSDSAKSLAHRDAEREALRAAIREDITREDWDAVYSLLDQMANRFGYREEAQRFREEIDQSRHDAIESKINMAIQQIEGLFAACDWQRARAEIKRLMTLYPDHERIAALPDRLEYSFTERKELLKRRFHEAAERKEVDRSISLIKDLDEYLKPDEAKELAAIVREIFRDKLDNLTVQFELAVHEQQWMQAVDVAKQIMAEYPNTRRAQELRDGVFASLLKRAGMSTDQVETT
jgi:hypothetical protein